MDGQFHFTRIFTAMKHPFIKHFFPVYTHLHMPSVNERFKWRQRHNPERKKMADEGKVVPSKEISIHYKTLPPPPTLAPTLGSVIS